VKERNSLLHVRSLLVAAGGGGRPELEPLHLLLSPGASQDRYAQLGPYRSARAPNGDFYGCGGQDFMEWLTPCVSPGRVNASAATASAAVATPPVVATAAPPAAPIAVPTIGAVAPPKLDPLAEAEPLPSVMQPLPADEPWRPEPLREEPVLVTPVAPSFTNGRVPWPPSMYSIL
jgi:hypothetical protein